MGVGWEWVLCHILRKISIVWLIRNSDTIITSFPEHYGIHNKLDPSELHTSLRERLRNLEPGMLNSVFDLAFLIIDQCSCILFDQSTPIRQRPEVIDIFTRSIAHTVSFSLPVLQFFIPTMLNWFVGGNRKTCLRSSLGKNKERICKRAWCSVRQNCCASLPER